MGRKGMEERGREGGGGGRRRNRAITPSSAVPAPLCPCHPFPPLCPAPQQGNAQERDGRRTEEEGLMPHGHQAWFKRTTHSLWPHPHDLVGHPNRTGFLMVK